MVEEGHSRNRTANVLNRMVVLPFVSVFDVPIDSRFRRRMSATGGEANDFLLTTLVLAALRSIRPRPRLWQSFAKSAFRGPARACDAAAGLFREEARNGTAAVLVGHDGLGMSYGSSAGVK